LLLDELNRQRYGVLLRLSVEAIEIFVRVAQLVRIPSSVHMPYIAAS
jgi:hypothetical protein